MRQPRPAARRPAGLRFRAGHYRGPTGQHQATQQHLRIEAGDVTALPDGRLLCTVARMVPYEVTAKQQKRTAYDYSYEKIAILDLQSKLVKQVLLYDSPGVPLHSPAFLGPRPRPPLLPEHVHRQPMDEAVHHGGVLLSERPFHQEQHRRLAACQAPFACWGAKG